MLPAVQSGGHRHVLLSKMNICCIMCSISLLSLLLVLLVLHPPNAHQSNPDLCLLLQWYPILAHQNETDAKLRGHFNVSRIFIDPLCNLTLCMPGCSAAIPLHYMPCKSPLGVLLFLLPE